MKEVFKKLLAAEKGEKGDNTNAATRITAERFLAKAAEMPLASHPYKDLHDAHAAECGPEWSQEEENVLLMTMKMWVLSVIGPSTAAVMNEILAVMRFAHATGDEDGVKAAEELAASMDFIEIMAQSFLSSIDFEEVARRMIADGRARIKADEEESAAAEAAKAKVVRTGTAHRPNSPSVN